MVWPFTSEAPRFDQTEKGQQVFNALGAYARDYQQAIQDPGVTPEQRAEVEQTFTQALSRVRSKIGDRMTDEDYWQTVNSLPAIQETSGTTPEQGIKEAVHPFHPGFLTGALGRAAVGPGAQMLNTLTAATSLPEEGTGIAGGTIGDIAGTAAATALASKIPGVSPEQAKGLIGLALKGGKEAVKYGAKRGAATVGSGAGAMLGSAAEQKLRKGDVDWTAAGIEGFASSIIPGLQAGKQVLGDAGAMLGRKATFAGDAFMQNAGANELRSTAREVFSHPDSKVYGAAFDKVMNSGVKVPSNGRDNLITEYLAQLTTPQQKALRAKLRVAPRPRGLNITRRQLNSFHDDILDNFAGDLPVDKPMSHLVRWRQSIARAARSTQDSALNDQLNDLVHVIDEHIDEGLRAAETQSFIYNRARQAAGPDSPAWQSDPLGQPGPGVAGTRTGSWEPMGRRAQPGEMPGGLSEGNPNLSVSREPLPQLPPGRNLPEVTPELPPALPPGRPGMRDIGQRTREESLPAVRGERLPMETPDWRPGQRPRPRSQPDIPYQQKEGIVTSSGWTRGEAPPPRGASEPPPRGASGPSSRAWSSRPRPETYTPYGPGGEYAPRGIPPAGAYSPHGPGGEYAPRGLPPGKRPTPMDDWNMSPAQTRALYEQANRGYWFFRAQEGLEDLVSSPQYTGIRGDIRKGDYRKLEIPALLNALEAPVGKHAEDVVDRLSREPGAYEEIKAMLKRLQDQNLTTLRLHPPDQHGLVPNPRRGLITAMLSPTGRALLEEAVVRGEGKIPSRELARIINQSRRSMGLTPEIEERAESPRLTQSPL